MTKVSGDWLTHPATQSVISQVEDAGHQIYLVGGCVRNALMGEPVSDIDLASDAPPDVLTALFDGTDMKVIPTGIDHGTITVVADGLPHEITTFRKDVETDGRRAVVAFSDRIEDDARRRDFTVNALYADGKGVVTDPLGTGIADLEDRRWRFIEDAGQRIREDYLRSLRFFRFAAWYGDPEAGMDAEALAAIAGNLDGLDTLSKERVGSEMLKLLSAPDPGPSVASMEHSGVLLRILPGASSAMIGPLVHFENALGLGPDAIRRLAAIGGQSVSEALRLSKRDTVAMKDYQEAMSSNAGIAELAYRFDADFALGVAALRGMSGDQVRLDADKGASARFPIAAQDLMPELTGPAIGEAMQRLEADWIASGFMLDKAALVSRV